MIDSGELVRAIGALAAVIGLVLASGLVLRRLERSRFGVGAASARLEIVTQRALDPKTRLVLLRCDTTEHLVVIGPGGCTALNTGMPTPARTMSLPDAGA